MDQVLSLEQVQLLVDAVTVLVLSMSYPNTTWYDAPSSNLWCLSRAWKEVKDPCTTCHGTGHEKQAHSVHVKFQQVSKQVNKSVPPGQGESLDLTADQPDGHICCEVVLSRATNLNVKGQLFSTSWTSISSSNNGTILSIYQLFTVMLNWWSQIKPVSNSAIGKGSELTWWLLVVTNTSLLSWLQWAWTNVKSSREFAAAGDLS